MQVNGKAMSPFPKFGGNPALEAGIEVALYRRHIV
jgi:hypothetical protein